ncbi:MAG: hypothetical protein HKP21_05095 [Xanthomonadales bacterium]|nr:hypothetical protein [Gammaproteobacteria bacterium]MBT8073067.1 hypothetical protein [Gammaproteobacteria bacterium]NNK03909.1 hypothetical protein [Xanthomonadales bacterium]
MKMTTKLTTAAVALACALPVAADNHETDAELKLAIHHVHVKMGHGAAFRAGMEAYSACLAEGGYDGDYSVWQAVDGDRTGYHIVSQFEMWAEFDEDNEVSDGCWANDEIRNGVFDHMSSWETQYAERLADWSGDAEGYTVVKLHNFRVEDGSAFRSLVGEMTGYMKEAEYEHMGTWYDVMGGGSWDADYFVVEHFENYAAMDGKRKGANGVLQDAVGEEKAEQFWDNFGETLTDEKGYWTNMLERQDSMGYSPAED